MWKRHVAAGACADEAWAGLQNRAGGKRGALLALRGMAPPMFDVTDQQAEDRHAEGVLRARILSCRARWGRGRDVRAERGLGRQKR